MPCLCKADVASDAFSLCAQANHMIQQEFEFVAEGDKFAQLVRLLEREMDGSRLLVFCETKRGCDAVTRQLRQSGWPALSIHGDKSQDERDWVLSVRLPTLHLTLRGYLGGHRLRAVHFL